MILMVGHRHGLVKIVAPKASSIERSIKGFLLQDLVDSHHQAVALAVQTPSDLQLQVQAVQAWAWLQQARQHVDCIDTTKLAPASFVKAVGGGPSAVEKWISTSTAGKTTTLEVITEIDAQQVIDFRSEVSRLD